MTSGFVICEIAVKIRNIHLYTLSEKDAKPSMQWYKGRLGYFIYSPMVHISNFWKCTAPILYFFSESLL